jgi:hypothetical protein
VSDTDACTVFMCVQMSLRSLLMEDLSVEPDSKHRRIVVSSAVTGLEDKTLNHPPEFYSKSCPNLLNHRPITSRHGSLPDHLETETVYESFIDNKRRKSSEYNFLLLLFLVTKRQ